MKSFFYLARDSMSLLTRGNTPRISVGASRGLCLTQIRFYGKRHKICDVKDAVRLVGNNDTLSVSGFVCQGAPEALLRELGQRFEETGTPKNLSVVFGGGPGDFDVRGLNHLAKPGMISRSIGGHYGQVPKLAKMALANDIEAYCVPMGSVSRMIRAAASEVPGHITKVGLGTFIDPRQSGGKLNKKSKADVVELVSLKGEEYLMYHAVPIDVALIRATTGDPEGNLSFEKESLLGDARAIAMAARSSGGICIAQVERIAAIGSIPMRKVHIPGALVDCVVVCPDAEDSSMSFFTQYNASWSGEIREPLDSPPDFPLNARKVIARRAALELKVDQIVNLGIGMPEGIATVAMEEGIFQHVTLTTEGGVFGGVGASGHEFGPASCPSSLQEINQQFDFYNGGGLDICFLGLAQCSQSGDVNVSRLTEDSLTGPGGFIDITQCTGKVVFMGTFRKKGFKMQLKDVHDNVKNGEDGTNSNVEIEISTEGQFSTFMPEVREITFSSKVALERGQEVLYITERAVFILTGQGLKLVEVAPGIDIDRDILSQMDFKPIIDRENIKLMDNRIFSKDILGLSEDMFSVSKALETRLTYQKEIHTLYLDLSSFFVNDLSMVKDSFTQYRKYLDEVTNEGKNKLNVVVNYDGFDIRDELEELWHQQLAKIEEKYYDNVRRYSGRAFLRHKLAKDIHITETDELWHSFFSSETEREILDRRILRSGMSQLFNLHVSPSIINRLMLGRPSLKKEEFPDLLDRIKDYELHGTVSLTELEEKELLTNSNKELAVM